MHPGLVGRSSVLLALLLLALGAIVFTQVTGPKHSFEAKMIISAGQMNENFEDLYDQLNATNQKLAELGAKTRSTELIKMASGASNEGIDNGPVPGRSLTYIKQHEESVLRVLPKD